MSTTTCLTSGAAAETWSLAMNYFMGLQCVFTDSSTEDLKSAELEDGCSYDYIIVGGGAAGSVLANRLSEISDVKILLLEAGGNPPPESGIPQLSNTLHKTRCDWNFTTVNDGVSGQALADGTQAWPAGRVIGGCTTMNPIFFDSCNSNDFPNWGDEWTSEIVAKYFKMIENLQDPTLLEDSSISEYYGKEGPIPISTSKFTYDDMLNSIVNSCDEIGIPKQKDLNFANNMGAGRHRTIDSNGVRNNMAKLYLNPIADRSNLDIVLNALVTKVLIDSDLKTKGVEVDVDGTSKTIYANKEVIVSAGAIKSPQLLMLSGIGACEQLESVGVTPLFDSPMVGQNLQTHSYVPVWFAADEPGPFTEADEHFSVIQYLHDHSGNLAQPIQADATMFYSKDSTAKFPDYQCHLVVHHKNSSTIQKRVASRFIDSESSNIMTQVGDRALMEFSLQVLHPESTGYIELASTDAEKNPLIYWNNFASSADLDSAATGCQTVTKLLDTTYFKSINAELVTVDYCKDYEANSSDYWKCVANSFSTSLSHPVGTCRMGTDSTTSVVDYSGKVHGLEGLRVVDASIISYIPSGNTFAPVVMLAERICDLIKTENSWTDYIHITE